MTAELCLILHAHLPFVRHADQTRFYEESWLYEATVECYLPLLRLLEAWWHDGVPAKLTISLSSTLCSMLSDRLLQDRLARYLESRIELAEAENARTGQTVEERQINAFYRRRLRALREFYARYEGNLLEAFRLSQERGQVELICSTATHAILPLLEHRFSSVRAQILIARDRHRDHFGREPRGIWLPECAYAPGIEPFLAETRIQWFVLEAHGVQWARPQPQCGVYAPVLTAEGHAAFARDPYSVNAIWSRESGYPGDERYRDFYRDLGYDRPYPEIKRYLPDGEHRGFTGLKYHRIGEGPDGQKELYRRPEAMAAVKEHADDFLRNRMAQAFDLYGRINRPPLLVAPFDAELFGHWWFEGPEFLDAFVRQACRQQSVLTLTTPTEHLQRAPSLQAATPNPSSWGAGGFYRVWLNEDNHWIWPHLDAASERMETLLRRFDYGKHCQWTRRSLVQAARELLLAQASDWPFLIYSGTARDYAARRVKAHLLRFIHLARQLESTAHVDPAWLLYLERTDKIFPDLRLDYWRPT